MKKYFILLPCMLLSHWIMAQNIFKAKVVNDLTKAILKGATATIPVLKISAAADTSGLIIIPNVPNGNH